MDQIGGLTAEGPTHKTTEIDIDRRPGQIWIKTDNCALVLDAGVDGRLSQLHFGAVDVEQEITDKPIPFHPAGGDGWFLEPALRITHADGNTSTDLRFEGKSSTRIGENVTLTRIVLRDPVYPVFFTLNFKAYGAHDVIEQWIEIRHDEPTAVTLHNFASSAPSFDPGTYWLTQFHGAWSDEMHMAEEKLGLGIKILDSKLGVRAQEFRNASFILSKDGPALENTGEVFVGTLAWSGSFQFAFEVDHARRLRAVCGMNPYASEYHLDPQTTFTTPSMIWAWSKSGKGDVSRRLHRWARQYGVRDGAAQRAVLLNNWEATYFDFDEQKIVSLFDGGKALGMDLFLLDDGWFGSKHARNDDTTGLGDWHVNKKKLPHGISYLADEAKKRDLRFGIWVEPEMVSPKSELFANNPEWAIRQPGRELHLHREQLVLDLTRPEVREFAFGIVDEILSENPGVSYVKWDCNRFITQPGSSHLGPARQSHLWIEYTRALYDIMERIMRKHPKVQFMICAGGGGRVDYGALRYGHEFWPSDNTDPEKRIFIQWGYSQVFPALATCNHVTRAGARPIKFAFDVAMSGRLGMDIDITHLTEAEREFATSAIAVYKTIADVVQFGDLYRLESPYEGDRASLLYATDDKRRAVLFAYQLRDTSESTPIALHGLDPERRYRVQEINLHAGSRSNLAIDGQIVSGEDLMREGIVTPIQSKHSSAVINLSEAN